MCVEGHKVFVVSSSQQSTFTRDTTGLLTPGAPHPILQLPQYTSLRGSSPHSSTTIHQDYPVQILVHTLKLEVC